MQKINQRLKKVQDKINQRELLNFAYDYFRSITPEATGNAKKRTTKQGSDTIFADYPYAQRLDKGWSKQAPDGMSKPMYAEIRKYLREI